LAGWVEDVRNLGGIAFLIVRQRAGTFQVTVKKKSNEALFNQISKLVRESVVAKKASWRSEGPSGGIPTSGTTGNSSPPRSTR